MKRVCHVVFEHRSFDGRIFFKEAVSLARAGYDVVVLVPGLSGRWLGRRKDHLIPQSGPLVREGVRFASYPYRRWIPKHFGLRFALCRRDILAALERIQPDLCHFHEDNVTLDVAAELKERLPNTRLVFDYHEFFLHRLRFSEEKRRKLPHFAATENRMLAAADGVVTVSDFISEYYRTLTDKPVVTVMNSQSARLFPAGEPALPPDGTFWVVHEGRPTFDRGLRQIVDAARLLRSARVRFLVIGDLPPAELEWFNAQTTRDGTAERFRFTGFLPYQEVPAWLRSGHAGLCLNSTPNALTGTPNKFFNYLRFGLPIVTLAHPIMGPLVRDGRCGIVLPRPGVGRELADALDHLAADDARQAAMSAAATRLFTDELNWERMEERLLALYREVLAADAD